MVVWSDSVRSLHLSLTVFVVLQHFSAAQQLTIRQQPWRISCVTCMEPWPMMPSGSTPVKSSSRTPRWPSNAASWTASSNWHSTPIRMGTSTETSEETHKCLFLLISTLCLNQMWCMMQPPLYSFVWHFVSQTWFLSLLHPQWNLIGLKFCLCLLKH